MKFNEILNKLEKLNEERDWLLGECNLEYSLPGAHILKVVLSEKKLAVGKRGKRVLDFEVVRYFQCVPGGSEIVPINDLDADLIKKALKIKKGVEDWAEGKKSNPPKGYYTFSNIIKKVSTLSNKFGIEMENLKIY